MKLFFIFLIIFVFFPSCDLFFKDITGFLSQHLSEESSTESDSSEDDSSDEIIPEKPPLDTFQEWLVINDGVFFDETTKIITFDKEKYSDGTVPDEVLDQLLKLKDEDIFICLSDVFSSETNENSLINKLRKQGYPENKLKTSGCELF